MDSKYLDILELPKVLTRLASHAAFSASKSLAQSLPPTADLDEARRRQTETTEARRLLSTQADLTVGGARDVRPAAQSAARGVVLEPADLLDIKATLISARRLGRLFEKAQAEAPTLASIAARLEPVPGLIDAVSQVLDERGEVLDAASPALARIRRDLRVGHERLTSKLQRLITDPKIVPMLQEPIITQRQGRYVVPLRAEFKGQLKAVIHDQSSSGATLFVEPLTVVELNNEVRELELAERDELRRILTELSGQVGAEEKAIVQTVEAIAQLDLTFAKAKYAEALDAAEPVLVPIQPKGTSGHPGSRVRLLAARHPLLNPEMVVPIDLALDDDTYALVLTGPNTGGKTVTLKTAGLLALMAQCGLHIPAASGSELSVFERICADIGDEQSIEQSLSTFSAHIGNIIHILEQVGPRSLVLLDELGAGTDPQEGSALARAILTVLLERRVTTLVATHYPELKTFAHATPGVRNASVEFDLESLRPTFHLTVGLPGRSNALAIAERLGLEKDIIERARGTLAPEEVQAEGLLDEIHRQRDAARQATQDAQAANAAARELERELAERLEGIEEERLQVLEEARHEAESEVEAVREELRAIRRQLASAAQPLDALKAIETEMEAVEEAVETPIARKETPAQPEVRALKLGDRVLIRRLSTEGVVTDLGAEEAEVQIGRLRVRARLDELGRPEEPETKPRTRARRRKTAQAAGEAAAEPPPLEIDLRGRTVEEALAELDSRLDSAYLAGLPYLRVIHGKGTGRLRDSIRKILDGNPYVASFEGGGPTEGGEGVTVVRLAVG